MNSKEFYSRRPRAGAGTHQTSKHTTSHFVKSKRIQSMLAAATSIVNSSPPATRFPEVCADASSSSKTEFELEPKVDGPITIAICASSPTALTLRGDLKADEIENLSSHPRKMSDAELYLRLMSIMALVLAPSIGIAVFVVLGVFSALYISLMAIACLASLALAYYFKCRLEKIAERENMMPSDRNEEYIRTKRQTRPGTRNSQRSSLKLYREVPLALAVKSTRLTS
jgi:hypothetical protein